MLNRSAFILRPAQPYLDWAASLDDDGPRPDPDDEKTVYLVRVSEMDIDGRRALKRVWCEMFERELEGWHLVEEDWPQSRTFAMFRKWFRIEFHSIVEDLEGTSIYDEDADWDSGVVEGIKRGEQAVAGGRVVSHVKLKSPPGRSQK